jgi:hypothetical protein
VDAHKYDGDEPCGLPRIPSTQVAERPVEVDGRLPIRGCRRAGSPYLSGQGWLRMGARKPADSGRNALEILILCRPRGRRGCCLVMPAEAQRPPTDRERAGAQDEFGFPT